MDQSVHVVGQDGVAPDTSSMSTKVVQQGPGNAARDIYNAPVHIHYYYPSNPEGLSFPNDNRGPVRNAGVRCTTTNADWSCLRSHTQSHNVVTTPPPPQNDRGGTVLSELEAAGTGTGTVVEMDDYHRNADPTKTLSLWEVLKGLFPRRRRRQR